MNAKPRKPRSPATPSRPLGDSVADVRKLYDEYSHAKFTKVDIASQLNLSSTSGPFAGRLFTLKEYGLLTQDGDQYTVSDAFMTLNSTEDTDPRFKSTALAAIRGSKTFQELLDDFKTKLPSTDSVAQRLENEKRFNRDRAREVARVLEKSLRYAGVLDTSNNILSPNPYEREEAVREERQDPGLDALDENLPPDTLSIEIPVGEERKVVIHYPRDLSQEQAKKVGLVLDAIVS